MFSSSSRKQSLTKPKAEHARSKIIHLKSITSTNDYAKLLVETGAQDGTAIRSDVQTRGRGRAGSIWISPYGGLWISIILRPQQNSQRLVLIPLIASLAVTKVLKLHGVNGRIKWPNDVLVDNRKIAGILCESGVQGENYQWIVVGIGINVNNTPPRLTSVDSKYDTASMIQITRNKIDLSSLARSLRDSLLKNYETLQGGGEEGILDEYNDQQILRGCKIRVSIPNRILEGVAGEVDFDGQLSLECQDGSTRKLRSEEVLLVESL